MSKNLNILNDEQRAKLVIIRYAAHEASNATQRIQDYMVNGGQLRGDMVRHLRDSLAIATLLADLLMMLDNNPKFFIENQDAFDDAACKALEIQDFEFEHPQERAECLRPDVKIPALKLLESAPQYDEDSKAPEERFCNPCPKDTPKVYRDAASWIMVSQQSYLKKMVAEDALREILRKEERKDREWQRSQQPDFAGTETLAPMKRPTREPLPDHGLDLPKIGVPLRWSVEQICERADELRAVSAANKARKSAAPSVPSPFASAQSASGRGDESLVASELEGEPVSTREYG